MQKDQSYGVIPLKSQDGAWLVLLVYQSNGFWGFPKGHGEKDETPLEAAERELFEETALKVERFLSSEPITEFYKFTWRGERIHKQVDYYPALVEGQIAVQASEILEARWFSLDEAFKTLTYAESKNILRQVIASLDP